MTHILREATGDFTGSSTSAFPYALSAKNDQNIFLPDCVPEGVHLSDPDHLTTSQINLLYAHWLQRQYEGLPPLIILNASPLHGASMKKSEKSKGKGKGKVGWVDVTTDGEEEEEEESQDEQNEDGDGEEEEDDDEGNEDAGGRKNAATAGTPPIIKYGPPQGKQKKKSSSAQQAANPAVAGPSTIPPLKRVSKASKAGKASKPPQSQPPSIAKTTSNLLSISTVSSQVLFELMTCLILISFQCAEGGCREEQGCEEARE